MEHLPENLEGEIVDLGCGNGVIGLTLLAKNPEASVVFSDESPMAVASSRLNVETNLPEALDRCEFMINNALSGVEPFRFNAVFCNPPFHQKHALTDNVAWGDVPPRAPLPENQRRAVYRGQPPPGLLPQAEEDFRQLRHHCHQ